MKDRSDKNYEIYENKIKEQKQMEKIKTETKCYEKIKKSVNILYSSFSKKNLKKKIHKPISANFCEKIFLNKAKEIHKKSETEFDRKDDQKIDRKVLTTNFNELSKYKQKINKFEIKKRKYHPSSKLIMNVKKTTFEDNEGFLF